MEKEKKNIICQHTSISATEDSIHMNIHPYIF